ncbi:MAG: (Fe-S)-binding protein [Gammaproteobacteria bacterium]|nr:(Fe-S)-binding protein [Gammaproteobacteria bacterium]
MSRIALNTKQRQQLLAGSDRCVLCGLCLPYCPTYQRSRCEGESPRGRVTLIQALLSGQIEVSSAAIKPLDNCLLCGNCEAFCPSQVPYAMLLDTLRSALVRSGKKSRPWLLRGLLAGVRQPRVMQRLARWGGRYRRSAVYQWLQVRLPSAIALRHQQIPVAGEAVLQANYPAIGASGGRVVLLRGCMGDAFEQQTLHDSVTLLTRLGRQVILPPAQCCGALHQHNGEAAQAAQMLAALRQQLVVEGAAQKIESVLYSVGGCHGQYRQLQHEFPLQDLISYFANIDLAPLKLQPTALRVAVHEPCSSRNLLKNSLLIYRLLAQIPAITLLPLSASRYCCGAAGSFMLTDPQAAALYRAPYIEEIQQLAPDLVVTPNLGCQLHLYAGLSHLPVLHPVSLLCRALPDAQ